MTRLAAAFALSVTVVASTTRAQAPEPAPAPPPANQPAPSPVPQATTANRHLGFALRLDPGFRYLATSSSPVDASIEGVGASFGILVGGAVWENLILGGEVWDAVAVSPTLTQGGTSVPGVDASLALFGVGVSLTYYLMPANVYVSVSPALTSLSLTNGGLTGSTEIGFGMKIAIGKEWWVGDHWGIGVAGQLFFSSNKYQATSTSTWSSLAGGLAFSATYN